MNLKWCGSKDCDIIGGTILTISLRDWGKPGEISVTVFGVPAKIQNRHLPHTQQEHYQLSQLGRYTRRPISEARNMNIDVTNGSITLGNQIFIALISGRRTVRCWNQVTTPSCTLTLRDLPELPLKLNLCTAENRSMIIRLWSAIFAVVFVVSKEPKCNFICA